MRSNYPVFANRIGQMAIVFVATLLSAIAVNLFIECNIGSDTLTVLLDGLHKSLGISVGLASFGLSIVFLATGLWLNHKSIGSGSIMYCLLIGPSINWIHPLIADMDLSQLSLWTKISIVLLANICFSTTYVLLMNFSNGMYALDAVLRYVESKFGLRYDIGRIGVDAVFFSTGLFLGGVAGIGTIIAFALTGPVTLLLEKMLLKFKRSLAFDFE